MEHSRLEQAKKLTNKMLEDNAFMLFHYPVEIEGYTDIIKEPMDLTTIKNKMDNGMYRTLDRWKDDVEKIFQNARKYNAADDMILSYTAECQRIFKKELKKIDPANINDEIREQLSKLSKLITNSAPKSILSILPKDDRYTSDQLMPFREDDNAKLIEKINNLTNEEEIVKVTQIMEYFNISKLPSNRDEARYHSDQLTEDAKRYLRSVLPK